MSGPKTSRYTLSPEQRRFLQDQLAVRHSRAALQNALAELLGHASFVKEHSRRIKDADLSATEAEIAAVKAMLAAPVPDTPAVLHDFRQQTDERLRQALRVASLGALQQQSQQAQIDESIAQDIAGGFAATLDDLLDQTGQVRSDYSRRLQRIAAQAVTAETAELARRALQQLSSMNDALLSSFAAITVTPLEQRHQREAVLHEAERADYQLLVCRYDALCSQLNLPCAPAPWHPGAAEQLRQQIADMEQLVYRQEEQAYIRQALDEVMVDMGYALLGQREVRKRSGARFHHALYTLGDGTAVDVTYDANGQIAMELGGLDDADRFPDARETALLCSSMEDFCTSFEEVEARLAARGVVLKDRISLLPPAADYAQIINVQDYCDASGVTLLHEQRSAVTERTKSKYLTEE